MALSENQINDGAASASDDSPWFLAAFDVLMVFHIGLILCRFGILSRVV